MDWRFEKNCKNVLTQLVIGHSLNVQMANSFLSVMHPPTDIFWSVGLNHVYNKMVLSTLSSWRVLDQCACNAYALINLVSPDKISYCISDIRTVSLYSDHRANCMIFVLKILGDNLNIEMRDRLDVLSWGGRGFAFYWNFFHRLHIHTAVHWCVCECEHSSRRRR